MILLSQNGFQSFSRQLPVCRSKYPHNFRTWRRSNSDIRIRIGCPQGSSASLTLCSIVSASFYMPPFPSSFSSIFIVLRKEELIYEKGLHWLDDCLEKFLLFLALAAMAVIMGIQVFCRSVLFMSLSWSEELTRCLFIWSGFLSVSCCTIYCISIKIEQVAARLSRRK